MLVLDEPTPEFVKRFEAGEPDAARSEDPTFARWARAAKVGAHRESDGYPQATSSSDLAARKERLDDVFREERALFEPIAAELSARSLVAVVADAEGVILASRGTAFESPAAQVRLIEGARWSEDARGTNAIGTAIVEKRSVAVLGSAHFEVRNCGLFCYAKPILDAYGDLVAVLDVTGPMSRHDRAVGLAVESAGSSLERALRSMAYAHAGAGALGAIERLVRRAGEPAFLVEASGHVRIANGAARVALRMSDNGGYTCEQVFGLGFAELRSLALNGVGGMCFEAKAPRTTEKHEVELDPIAGADGRVLAVLVHLARRSSTAMRMAPQTPPVVAHKAFDSILAADDAVIAAKAAATRFASTALPVLLLAESGTGKELFARAIHAASPRSKGAFVALNCGALASGVLESELFGYAPGAFTGGLRAGSQGKLAAAHGGTLLLDEIAEMPDALQAALLRVLDDGAFYRVGDPRPSRSDFRLLCATSRDLPALVARGVFRRDLFFRIHGACITIPPLRERSDRVYLARELLRSLSTDSNAPSELTRDAESWILEYAWPGNVRELRTALVHAIAMAAGEPITRAHFPKTLVDFGGLLETHPTRTRDELLHDAIVETVDACGGNVSEAARRLHVARSTIYRALQDRSR